MQQPVTKNKLKDIQMLDAVEHFIAGQRTALQHREDLSQQVNEGVKVHGRSWKPLYELFEPMGLLPIEAGCNGIKHDSSYGISKIAVGRVDFYLPIMKRIAGAISDRRTGGVEFSRSEYKHPEDWNQLRNLFRNMQQASVVVIDDLGERISISPEPKYRNFLDGAWAERGMVYLIDKTIKSFSVDHKLSSSIFWNVKLADKSPWNVTKMELDIVAKVGKRFYVFEVKTGALLPIDKWFDRWQLFKEAGVKYIQCTVKVIDHKLFLPLTLFPIANVEELLRRQLEKDFTTTSSYQR